MKDFIAVATDAALKAGRMLRENIHGLLEITSKGDINLVTEMDMHSERMIVKMLRVAFPDHSIVAEDEAKLSNASGHTWIIDPLDGTTNYAHGYPCFAVSIVLRHEDYVILGVVYDPMRDELFAAQKGRGVYLNGKPIKVSQVGTHS